MYTALNLNISLNDFVDNQKRNMFIERGKQRKEQFQANLKVELKQFTSASGTIDGSELSDDWFKTVRSDVFISHSHNDEDLAFAVAGWLQSRFGLEVFLDEFIWGSADELLRAVDDKFCLNSDHEFYDYNKRNLTTSHIHAMLSTAIYKVMDKTEVLLFLNTKESIPTMNDTIKENSQYTLSPWIYQELMAVKLLRITDWSTYRRYAVLEHAQYKADAADIKIAYKTPLNELKAIDVNTLNRWAQKYATQDLNPHNVLDHPLNFLYETVFGRREGNREKS